ncbi:MAG: hypothetical protein M1834_008198 [Cirrosporium novae-zelandiae]|nr:MAG: hypothetical protein M1834_008198 [Cirrosporium novae-zelandiae]
MDIHPPPSPPSDFLLNQTGISSVAASPSRERRTLPADIATHVFPSFPAQTLNDAVPSPIRRKPLPPNASPITTKPRSATGGAVLGGTVGRHWDGLTTSAASSRPPWLSPPEESPPFAVSDLDKFPRGESSFPQDQSLSPDADVLTPTSASKTSYPSGLRGELNASPEHTEDASSMQRSGATTLQPPDRPTALKIDINTHSHKDSHDSVTKTPKTPGRFQSFFGWKSASSPGAESSSTEISDTGHSNIPSPLAPSPQTTSSSSRSIPPAIDVSKANASLNVYSDTDLPLVLSPISEQGSKMVEDLEGELREISAELASSIKRELDLEDLVERLQAEAERIPDGNRRTSDYFSDSGTSSVTGYRYPMSDYGVKLDDIEKMRRSSEQQIAQVKIDLSKKVQDERVARVALESLVATLEKQLDELGNGRSRSSDSADRVQELESSLEGLRRRLAEEKQMKENFEDLLAALKEQIEQERNERDNLKDEVVPQLRARVEGLEAEAAQSEKLSYELAKVQQEVQSLRNENQTLVNARHMQLQMEKQQARFNSIAEEGELPMKPGVGLSRSNSLARTRSPTLTRATSLRRSSTITIKEKNAPPHESLVDKIKDVEVQRDALHRSLKSLIERHQCRERENAKTVKQLEIERDRALNNGTPGKLGYEREVKTLRDEVNHLRKRADDALEQKWQCEKGLGGLKIDLDRAEQETSSLRALLEEHDILVPGRSSQDLDGAQTTSEALQKAYNDLQTTQAQSLARMRELNINLPNHTDDEQTSKALDALEESIAQASAEHDSAEQAEARFRDGLAGTSLEEEQKLADQLRASSERITGLSIQVRQQLDANSSLRRRLAEAIGRGEKEQKNSAARINELQRRLKGLEEHVITAQQHSEDAVMNHEEEVRQLKKSHNDQLQRMRNGLRSPSVYSPRTPLTPIFTNRSPKLDLTTSGRGKNMNQASRVEFLENKVTELEKALSEADRDMQEVVGRMNMAQIEVAELQSDRDEAMRQSRRLQAEVSQEREKVKALLASK